MVVWITGVSGSGKSTLATACVERLRSAGHSAVLIDGDTIREIVGDQLGHSHQERLTNAFRMSRLCRFLAAQGPIVFCATMSLFPEIWAWNRANIPGYFEVYLRVKPETVKTRDPKGIYRRAEQGLESNVVGIDLPLIEPSQPNLVIDNDGNNIDEQVTNILKNVNSKSVLG